VPSWYRAKLILSLRWLGCQVSFSLNISTARRTNFIIWYFIDVCLSVTKGDHRLYNNQKAASSVVFSDLFNLNRTVYLYVFSCISLFLCTIIHLTRHQSLIHKKFCITRVASKNHLWSFFMTATLYPCISWLLP
jgi:hypothetical protein